MRTSEITLQCYSSGDVRKELLRLRLETKSFHQMPGKIQENPLEKYKAGAVKQNCFVGWQQYRFESCSGNRWRNGIALS